jgi:hypothetical protein
MVPAHARRQNGKHYGYYVCMAAQKRGWDTCPTKSVAAATIEQVVVEQIRSLSRDPEALRALVGQISDEAPNAAEPAERNGCDTDDEVAVALAACTGEWEALAPQQRDLLVQRLIERVDYDGVAGRISITFHASAIHALAQERLSRTQENNP